MAATPCELLRHFAVLLLLFSTGYAQNSGGSCRTPNGQAGQCVSIVFCEAYRELLNQRPLPPNTVNFLRRAQCGFEGNRPFVCCPTSGSAPPPTSGGGNRPPPNQGGGSVRPPPQQGSSTGSGETSQAGEDVTNHPNWRYLSTDVCGADANDRIYGGEEALLKEYPWLALLQYQTRNGLQFLCGGALIGKRYVLTAAHCVTGIGNTRLAAVRLGEHNTDTEPDCVTYQDGTVCGDPIQDFNIAETIVHPQYQSSSRDKYHDIALLRLDRDAPVTDYIVPICIPNGAAINKRYETEAMIVAGWGRTENKSASDVKLWVRVPVMTNSQCAPVYQRQLTLHNNQMCAGGEQGKDSCRGDSGGPLMSVDSVVPRRRGGQWVVAGVVSIGPQICGTGGRPGIYTRVGPYVKWILDNVKA